MPDNNYPDGCSSTDIPGHRDEDVAADKRGDRCFEEAVTVEAWVRYLGLSQDWTTAEMVAELVEHGVGVQVAGEWVPLQEAIGEWLEDQEEE